MQQALSVDALSSARGSDGARADHLARPSHGLTNSGDRDTEREDGYRRQRDSMLATLFYHRSHATILTTAGFLLLTPFPYALYPQNYQFHARMQCET